MPDPYTKRGGCDKMKGERKGRTGDGGEKNRAVSSYTILQPEMRLLRFPCPADQKRQREYVEAMKREIAASGRRRKLVPYFSEAEHRLCFRRSGWRNSWNLLRQLPVLQRMRKFPMEANPGTLTAEKLSGYRKAGINRLSLGCQSARNEDEISWENSYV